MRKMRNSINLTIENLSLPELAAQMVVVRASGYLFDHQIRYPEWEPPTNKLRYWLENLGVGGVILVGGSAAELAVRSQLLQSWAKFPLLLAADIEEGVGQRFAGATWFPPPMAIGAIAGKSFSQAEALATAMGEITATEAIAIGLNWILAPVVDVNNNPDNPVINVRAFGETPDLVSALATAFIRGTQQYPVLTTAKHFPGHGDTAVDSHLQLPSLPHSAERLAEIELPPFQAAISAGVDAVMSAHLLIPEWDDKWPATLSHQILTGKLRQELGFEGLIVTDALVMGAIAGEYGATEAAVLAVEAGADILLMPQDPEATIKVVCDAVTQGRISRSRLEISVKRIWQAKTQVGLFSPPSSSPSVLSILPSSLDVSATILRNSLLVGGALPLQVENPQNGEFLRNLIIVDDILGCEFLGNHTPAIAIPKQLGYKLQIIDDRTETHNQQSLSAPSNHPSQDRFSSTLLQIFIRGNCFRGSAGLTEAATDLFNKLLTTGKLSAIIIYGSPYILEKFLPTLPPSIPYIFSYGQMPTAQAIALETLFNQDLRKASIRKVC
ncbi:beta-glucosidase [Oscillatoriales cyanobacterium USR001]|nr:beta-glucosidase [Oscillatoriales cyanobacterium USR001]